MTAKPMFVGPTVSWAGLSWAVTELSEYRQPTGSPWRLYNELSSSWNGPS